MHYGEVVCMVGLLAGLMIVLHSLRLRGLGSQLAWVGYGMLLMVAMILITARWPLVPGWW